MNAPGVNWLELELQASAYELSVSGQVLARLEGGPAALLRGAGVRLRDVDIESAIERAEDWLMPSSKSWQGFALRLQDASGRLRDHFGAHATLLPEDVERAFSRVVDEVAFGRPIDVNLVADLVLVRELVHHGRLLHVVFE